MLGHLGIRQTKPALVGYGRIRVSQLSHPVSAGGRTGRTRNGFCRATMPARFARRVSFRVSRLLLRAVLDPVTLLLADIARVVLAAVLDSHRSADSARVFVPPGLADEPRCVYRRKERGSRLTEAVRPCPSSLAGHFHPLVPGRCSSESPSRSRRSHRPVPAVSDRADRSCRSAWQQAHRLRRDAGGGEGMESRWAERRTVDRE